MTGVQTCALPISYGGGGEDEVRGRREDGVGEVAAAKRFVAGVVGRSEERRVGKECG